LCVAESIKLLAHSDYRLCHTQNYAEAEVDIGTGKNRVKCTTAKDSAESAWGTDPLGKITFPSLSREINASLAEEDAFLHHLGTLKLIRNKHLKPQQRNTNQTTSLQHCGSNGNDAAHHKLPSTVNGITPQALLPSCDIKCCQFLETKNSSLLCASCGPNHNQTCHSAYAQHKHPQLGSENLCMVRRHQSECRNQQK